MTTPHDDQAQIDPLDARIPIDLMAFPEDEDDEVAAFSRVPSLAKPFAAFGAAAGLFAILALGSFRASAREVSPLTPMIATALVGAVALMRGNAQ